MQDLFKLVDGRLGLLKIVSRFPGVIIRVIIVLPFHEILNLSLLRSFIKNFLDLILFVTHDEICNLLNLNIAKT